MGDMDHWKQLNIVFFNKSMKGDILNGYREEYKTIVILYVHIKRMVIKEGKTMMITYSSGSEAIETVYTYEEWLKEYNRRETK